ncbi:MAG: hypothetical protein ACRC6M_08225 [Microcystaceae cyanobacterium]
MKNATITAKTLAEFIDKLSETASSIDFDCEIIESIVNGWVKGDPSDKEKLKAKLAEISTLLD